MGGGTASLAYADTVTIPLTLEVVEAPLDFTINTEGIALTAYAGETDVAMDPIIITNIGAEDLKLSEVRAEAATGWTQAAYSAAFDSMSASTKTFGMQADGSHDLTAAYAPADGIITAGGGAKSVALAMKIVPQEVMPAETVANVVVTIAKAGPKLISFSVDLSPTLVGVLLELQAEEGMTWGEWCASKYNTLGFEDHTTSIDFVYDSEPFRVRGIPTISQHSFVYSSDVIENRCYSSVWTD